MTENKKDVEMKETDQKQEDNKAAEQADPFFGNFFNLMISRIQKEYGLA